MSRRVTLPILALLALTVSISLIPRLLADTGGSGDDPIPQSDDIVGHMAVNTFTPGFSGQHTVLDGATYYTRWNSDPPAFARNHIGTPYAYAAPHYDLDWVTNPAPGWQWDNNLWCLWEITSPAYFASGESQVQALIHAGAGGCNGVPHMDSPGIATISLTDYNSYFDTDGTPYYNHWYEIYGRYWEYQDAGIWQGSTDIVWVDLHTREYWPTGMNITVTELPVAWADKFHWDLHDGLDPIVTYSPLLPWSLIEARHGDSWTYGLITCTAVRENRVDNWNGLGADPSGWAVYDVCETTVVSLTINDLIIPDASLPRPPQGQFEPMGWYIGQPISVEAHILPSSLDTQAWRNNIEWILPSYTTNADQPLWGGCLNHVQFWREQTDDLVAQLRVGPYPYFWAVEHRTMDVRDYFFSPNVGWKHPSMPSLFSACAFASRMVSLSGTGWDINMVSTVGSSEYSTIIDHKPSPRWFVADIADLVDLHRDLWNTKFIWDPGVGVVLRDSWASPVGYYEMLGLFDWGGFSYGHITYGDWNEGESGLEQFVMYQNNGVCHYAVAHSLGYGGLHQVGIEAWDRSKLLEAVCNALGLITEEQRNPYRYRLPTWQNPSIPSIETHTFSIGDVIIYPNHSARAVSAVLGTGVQTWSVHAGSPYGKKGGFATPSMAEYFTDHPDIIPEGYIIWVFPDPNSQ